MAAGQGIWMRAAAVGALIGGGLLANAPAASAVWPETVVLTATSPRLTRAPDGASAVHVVAVGGRGGGVNGGFGAVVSGVIPLVSRPLLRETIAVNGVFGRTIRDPANLPDQIERTFGSPAGAVDGGSGGGFTSLVAPGAPAVIAAGGGGSGGPSLLLDAPGGAGGNAGADGAPGSAAEGVAPAVGGTPARGALTGSPGVGSAVDVDSGCQSGDPGGDPDRETGTPRAPTRGAYGPGGAGGGGGAGVATGGGGGGGATCPGYSTSGAGGGGGASSVPPGGTVAIDTSGEPSLTLTWIHETVPPTITVVSPQANAEIRPHANVPVIFRCADNEAGVESCVGSVPPGGRLATDATGSFAFTVTASDHWGNTSAVTVPYVVGDHIVPKVAGLRIRRAGGVRRFEFWLTERSDIRAHVERRLRGVRVKGRCVTKPTARRTGGRCVRWRQVGHAVSRTATAGGKIPLGRRLLGNAAAPGRYRVTVVATDAAGNTSRAAQRTFAVQAPKRTRRPARRTGARRGRSVLFTSP